MSLGQTAGSPNTPVGAKAYYKPALGKMVLRKPGVLRRSTRVLERNRKVAASPPAGKCKGLEWKKFVTCLRKEMPR